MGPRWSNLITLLASPLAGASEGAGRPRGALVLIGAESAADAELLVLLSVLFDMVMGEATGDDRWKVRRKNALHESAT